MANKVEFKVFRYDPQRDKEPRYVSFRVELSASMTVLDGLRKIHREQDGSLCFRAACNRGKCGSCALQVNGRPALACRRVVTEETLVLEPLAGYPVLKDLVVDRERGDRRLRTLFSSLGPSLTVPLLPPRPTDDPSWPECVECLACDGACPILAAAPEVYLGPATIVALSGLEILPQATEESLGLEPESGLYSCLACESCALACPHGVDVGRKLRQAKEQFARADRLPKPLKELSRKVEGSHNITGEDNAQRTAWLANLTADSQSSAVLGAEWLYFVGCLSSLYPSSYRIPQAFVQLLDRARIKYGLWGSREWCCGYPLELAGLTEEAKQLADHNLERIRELGTRNIVTTCASCYYTWHRLVAEQDQSEKPQVRHAVQLLAQLIEEGRLAPGRLEKSVTYHDPCDLGRRAGCFDEPRFILNSIPGLKLVEMTQAREQALCCGGGGNLESYAPDLGAAIAQERIADAEKTRADLLVTACPQCVRTLRRAARKAGSKLEVVDLVELLWEIVAVPQ